MSLSKAISLPQAGEVLIKKRRGSRHLRISISHEGLVSVSIPTWAPFKMGIEYAYSKESWILQNKINPTLIRPGQIIGKAHHIEFITSFTGQRPQTRLTGNAIKIFMPGGYSFQDNAIQNLAKRAAIKALKQESISLLPQRLAILARQFGFEYRSVGIKSLKTRWGSCSHQKDITLNCYLMGLPWELIDYVILHELVHTRVLAHGTKFWEELVKIQPNVKHLRKMIRQYKPSLTPIKTV